MEENEIMTEATVMDDSIEETEYTDDSKGFPWLPAGIGTGLVAGAVALWANRKKIGKKIDEKKAEHYRKWLEDYDQKSIDYSEIKKNSDTTEK